MCAQHAPNFSHIDRKSTTAEVPRVAKGWHGIPRAAKGCQRLPRDAQGFQGLPRFAKGCQGSLRRGLPRGLAFGSFNLDTTSMFLNLGHLSIPMLLVFLFLPIAFATYHVLEESFQPQRSLALWSSQCPLATHHGFFM